MTPCSLVDVYRRSEEHSASLFNYTENLFICLFIYLFIVNLTILSAVTAIASNENALWVGKVERNCRCPFQDTVCASPLPFGTTQYVTMKRR
jgi:hypothetical protein